jgi:hypothetical protein
MIEKMMLAQMEDQCSFATMYDQELRFYSFQQETMSKPQWCKKFNTKVDVGSAIRITQQHKVLLEHVAQEKHTLASQHCQMNRSKQSARMLRSGRSHTPPYTRAEPNMVTSRWISGMTSPQAVTNTPRPISRLYTS